MKDGKEDTRVRNEIPPSVQTSSNPTYSNLNDALGRLKGSEFYQKPDALLANKSGPSKILRKGDVKSNTIHVSPKQRGNPLLKSITNVPWEYDEVIPDYVMGRTTCALFLSLRYHNLNPDYIHERLKALGQEYELRVLLVQVDTNDPHHPLKYLTRVCLVANLTLMLAWSAEEAGRIIETYKIYEHKPPDMIMERAETSIRQRLVSALTTVRSVNRTDASTLLNNFGSLKRIISSSKDSLSLCPGLGPQKATRLYNVLHQPFVKAKPPAKRKSSPLKTMLPPEKRMNFFSVKPNTAEKEEKTPADEILPSKKLNMTSEKERGFNSSSTLEKKNALKCKETTMTNVIPDKKNANSKIFSTTEKKNNPPVGKKTTFMWKNKD